MADLDTLRTEVREAIAYCDGIFDDADNGEWAIIRAELLRLVGDLNAACLSRDTFEAKYQCMRERAERAEAELAALKTRVAGSSVVKIANYGDPFIVLPDHFTVPNSLKGKTVRLLVEE